VLALSRVGFRQEGQGIVYPSQLSGLKYLLLVGLIGVLDNGLPDVSGKGLVRICCAQQLTVYPFLCYFLISVDSVIYVPSALR